MLMNSPKVKINIIGLFLFFAIVITATSVFTKYWIVFKSPIFGVVANVGIVPYHSNQGGWFKAASILMYISLALFGPLILVYFGACFKIYRHGCYHEVRSAFNLISLLCSVITLFELIAFFLFVINSFHSTDGLNEQIGSSAYLAMVSAILLGIPVAFSSHISRNDCH